MGGRRHEPPAQLGGVDESLEGQRGVPAQALAVDGQRRRGVGAAPDLLVLHVEAAPERIEIPRQLELVRLGREQQHAGRDHGRIDVFDTESDQVAGAELLGQELRGGRRFEVPRRAEAHRLLEGLARGGMGAVYEAVHCDLNKRVAVKTLLPAMTEHEEAYQRFLLEARAASRLRHPHIIEVTDFDLAPGEEKTLTFTATSLNTGEYAVRAIVESDDTVLPTNAETTVYFFDDEELERLADGNPSVGTLR